MRFINYHVRETPNLGDRVSAPLMYWGACVVLEDLGAADRDELQDDDVVVIGGGGLLFDKLGPLEQIIVDLLEQPRQYKVVVWGAGHNSSRDDGVYPAWLELADLVGVRDWRGGYTWAPCPSCMAPLFDDAPPPRYPVVIYDHYPRPVPFMPNRSMPRASNYMFRTYSAAIEFLAAGETVVTSSYHGAYWATLLGRRVITYGHSSKFRQMRHTPLHLDDDTPWQPMVESAPRYPDALLDCIRATMSFGQQVVELAGKRR